MILHACCFKNSLQILPIEENFLLVQRGYDVREYVLLKTFERVQREDYGHCFFLIRLCEITVLH